MPGFTLTFIERRLEIRARIRVAGQLYSRQRHSAGMDEIHRLAPVRPGKSCALHVLPVFRLIACEEN